MVGSHLQTKCKHEIEVPKREEYCYRVNQDIFHLARLQWEFTTYRDSRNRILFITDWILTRTQHAHDVRMTSYQRLCDVMTSHRRRSDVILTSCACWEYVCNVLEVQMVLYCGNILLSNTSRVNFGVIIKTVETRKKCLNIVTY